MSDISSKMYDCAKYLNELNAKGEIKGFKGNENGYAKIKQICRGCSFWVHHTKKNQLIIDLTITPSASRNQPQLCNLAKQKFSEIIDTNTQYTTWQHAIDSEEKHDRYFIEISENNISEINKLLNIVQEEL